MNFKFVQQKTVVTSITADFWDTMSRHVLWVQNTDIFPIWY